MKFASKKDLLKRKIYEKYELQYSICKTLFVENPVPETKLINSQKWITKHRIKNRCSLTSRSKGVLSFFKLSRMCFKEQASFGHLEGIRKSSW